MFYTWLVSFSAGLGGLLFGYEIGIVEYLCNANFSAILRMQGFRETFGLVDPLTLKETPQAADIKGNVTFSFLFGCICGAALASWAADALSRKRTIFIGAFLFTLGGALQSVAHVAWLFYTGRFVSGLSIGTLSMCVPLYISELAETRIRGTMVSIQQFMITFGIVVASCVNALFFLFLSGEIQWRVAIAMQVIPSSILLALMCFMPYSPRWLTARGRDGEAVTVLGRLRGLAPNSYAVQSEFNEIKSTLVTEREIGTAPWMDLTKRGIFPKVLTAMALQMFQQWTGINVILYYAGELFERMGLGGNATHSSLFVILNATTNFLATFPGMYLIERLGRKRLLIYGGVFMTLSHCLICFFIGFAKAGSSAFAWCAVACVYLFLLSYASTWGPVPWVFQSEVFPLRVRAKGTALATMSNWTWNAIIAKAAPFLLASIDYYTYAILGAMCLAMTAFAIFCVPETRGVSFDGKRNTLSDSFGVCAPIDKPAPVKVH